MSRVEHRRKRLTKRIRVHPSHVDVEPEPIQSAASLALTMRWTNTSRFNIPVHMRRGCIEHGQERDLDQSHQKTTLNYESDQSLEYRVRAGASDPR